MDLVKPSRLQPGDTVAVLSTSWGGPSRFPLVYEAGLDVLRCNLGLEVKEYPTARMDAAVLAKYPQARADDLNNAFADDEVAAIIATIGGDDSVRILPFLDPALALQHPKMLLGYADTATQLLFYAQRGLVTFNGPSVMAGFAQFESLPEAYQRHVRTTLFGRFDELPLEPLGEWSNGYSDWSSVSTASGLAERRAHDGWRWLQGSGVHRGPLFGGCIEVVDFLKGTPWWPADEFFAGKVLFFETSEEKPSAEYVRRSLRTLGVAGQLDRIAGLLFGRPRDYSEEEKRASETIVLDVVRNEFRNEHLPIVANLDFGHTDPQWILPNNVELRIDCDQQTLTLAESPTR